MEQLELDTQDLTEEPRSRTVVISSDAVDSLPPVVIEVVVDKNGPVSLELLTKLLIVGVVFLATRHIAPSVAIVGAILSAFLPDVISSFVRRRRWGKKRVGLLAALATFFATLDSAFGKAIGRRMPAGLRRVLRSAHGAGRNALGLGHAAATTAVAATVCAIAIAVPAVASGGSPFGTSSAPVNAPATVPATVPATPSRAIPAATHHAAAPATTATHPTQTSQPGHDVFERVGASATGVDGSVTLTPGQRVHLQFTLDQTSQVVFSERDGNTLNFDIFTDHGQPSDSINYDTSIPYRPGALVAGPHTITIENVGSTPGTLPFTLYASTDQTRTVKASPTGVDDALTLAPGQHVDLEFTLDQPSEVVLSERDGNTLNFDISTDHGQPSNSLNYDTSIPYEAGTLAAGPHTITIENVGSTPGTLPYTLLTHPA